MATKTISCRAHGGTFTIEARRGRPPVNCTGDNQCSAVAKPRKAAAARKRVSAMTTAPVNVKADRDAAAIKAARQRAIAQPTDKAPASAVRVVNFANEGVSKAQSARERLEPLGWKVSARKDGTDVILSAVRGEERLSLRWTDAGELKDQQYDMWSEVPARNNKPASKLPFNPDEISDRDLIRALAGTTVTWWNALAQANETAVVSAERVAIVHAYDGKGDETPADRVLTFVDYSGGGFRSFRIGALLKIGR